MWSGCLYHCHFLVRDPKMGLQASPEGMLRMCTTSPRLSKLLWPLQNIWTGGFMGFLGPDRVMQARWMYSIAGILKLPWPLQGIHTDGLVCFIGSDKVLLALAFRLMSSRKPFLFCCHISHLEVGVRRPKVGFAFPVMLSFVVISPTCKLVLEGLR